MAPDQRMSAFPATEAPRIALGYGRNGATPAEPRSGHDRPERADNGHSADGNRTTSGFRVSRRHAIRFLVAVPAAMRSWQRSPRARGNGPAFADMLVMEPTARDHAAMRRFRRKLGHRPFTSSLSNSSIILGVSFSLMSVYDRSGRRVTS
jgi:hypothetical protein